MLCEHLRAVLVSALVVQASASRVLHPQELMGCPELDENQMKALSDEAQSFEHKLSSFTGVSIPVTMDSEGREENCVSSRAAGLAGHTRAAARFLVQHGIDRMFPKGRYKTNPLDYPCIR